MGQAACLAAAFLWAFSANLFQRPIQSHGAPAVNLVKCTIAAVLLGLTTVAAGQTGRLLGAPPSDLGLILVSAWLGLTLGDTALFGAVARIGPYRTMLLQTLAPLFTAALAAGWQGEVPSARQAGGAIIILAGIALVIAPRRMRGAPPAPTLDGVVPPATARPSAHATAGILLAVVAAAGQGTGVVFAKAGMHSVPFVAASFLRMLAASAGLVVVAAPRGVLRRAASAARGPDALRLGGASFTGAYVAMMCMMAGVWLAPAAVAAVLLATTPIFSLFVDAWTLHEPVTLRGVAGAALAVAGVVVLTS